MLKKKIEPVKELLKKKNGPFVICFDYLDRFKDDTEFVDEKQIFPFVRNKTKYASFSINEMKNSKLVVLSTEERSTLNIRKNPCKCLEFNNGLPEAVKCLVSDSLYSLCKKKVHLREKYVSFALQGSYLHSSNDKGYGKLVEFN